jgi:glycosyltransferase involved in cell wall biosynthesis
MQIQSKNKKIAFLCPYPYDTAAPSQRFRFEQYLCYLNEAGFTYKVYPFLDKKTNALLPKRGHLLRKTYGITKGYLLRFSLLPKLLTCDYVFVHREASPLGPPIIEWLVAKVFRKKIIYDYDDAVWKTQADDSNVLVRWIKNPTKVNSIIKWSYKISCGNDYLKNHASAFNKSVVYNPTTIDTRNFYNKMKDQSNQRVSIGWSGSHSTLVYIEPLIPLIEKLNKKYDFDFVIICNKAPDFQLSSLVFVPWNKNTEIEDLLKLNVGLMPLPEEEWTLGKCGLKALQYMALGIPALVSPVGVNSDIVTDGKNGFLCKTEEDWMAHIGFLIENEKARMEYGRNARILVEENYSVHSNKINFINLFS